MRVGVIGVLSVALFGGAPLLAESANCGWRAQLHSPDGTLHTEIVLGDEGRLSFVLSRDGEPVLQPSPLGIRLANTSFVDGLTVSGASAVEAVADTYRLWGGKQTDVEYSAHELAVTLANSDRHEMTVRLRLSNDGLAYRYELLGASEDTRVVTSEASGFHFLPGTKAWLQPKAEARSGWNSTNPSYEEEYLREIDVGTPSPTANGWVYPALFRMGDTWIVLSETGMDGNYCGSSLAQESPDGLYRVRFPVIRYARDLLADAADFELLVNFHGATLPRGLQRTFPNLLTVEAVKGLEFVLARRAGDRWYVAGINGQAEAKTLDLDLSFIPSGPGRLLMDGEAPRDVQVSELEPGRQDVTLGPSSGFVMIFDGESESPPEPKSGEPRP